MILLAWPACEPLDRCYSLWLQQMSTGTDKETTSVLVPAGLLHLDGWILDMTICIWNHLCFQEVCFQLIDSSLWLQYMFLHFVTFKSRGLEFHRFPDHYNQTCQTHHPGCPGDPGAQRTLRCVQTVMHHGQRETSWRVRASPKSDLAGDLLAQLVATSKPNWPVNLGPPVLALERWITSHDFARHAGQPKIWEHAGLPCESDRGSKRESMRNHDDVGTSARLISHHPPTENQAFQPIMNLT